MEDQYSEFDLVRPSAFIVYQPHREKFPDAVLCNSHAWEILVDPPFRAQHRETPPQDIAALCRKWKAILEQCIHEAVQAAGSIPDSVFVDLFMSGRRRYRVKGFQLHDRQGSDRKKRAYFMFTLERIHRDSVNLPQIFREARLSKREQELVYEILADKGNKEIADTLGLSLNTVKVYLKNLMRKLNVTSRAGIVSFLLLTPSAKKQKGLARRPES